MKQFLKTILNDRKLIRVASGGGTLISLFSVFGYQLEKFGNVKFNSLITWLFVLLFSFVGSLLFITGIKLCERVNFQSTNISSQKRSWIFFLFTAVIIFLVWLPQLLGVYPGYYNYDANSQWEMYRQGLVTAHHPVVHTLLVGWFMDTALTLTGALNKGVFAYVLFQMLVTACCFSYVLTYFYRKNFKKGFIIFSLVWFACFPTVVINVFSITKDSMFAAFLMVFMVMTIEFLEAPEIHIRKPLFLCGWCISTFLTTIMRNNVIYVMIFFLPIIFLKLRKFWKRTLPIFGVIVVAYILYTGVFVPAVTVDGVSSKEFLSVPTQQLMRVYKEKYDELSPEDAADCEKLFGEIAIEYYNPKISDIVKFNFDMDEFNSNKKHYISLYLKQGLRYPGVYINSFLHNTYGFWYPLANLALDLMGNEGYFVCHCYPPAVDNSKFPAIYEYYLLFEDSFLVYGDSYIKILFLPGTYFWIFLFVLSYIFYIGARPKFMVLSFVLFIWLTFLLGPVALVRYVSFLYYMLPMEMAFLFAGNDKKAVKAM